MQSILSKVTKADIVRDPYPHVVIKNAIDPALADRLLSEYPSTEYLGKGRQGLTKEGKMPNNIKLRYHSIDILYDVALSLLWKEFTQRHLSGDFFMEYLRIFKDDLCQLYPHLTSFLDSITPEDVGVQHVDTYADKKILLNAEICADTPVRKVSSVRSLHLDHPNKLGVALLYLKGKDDVSVGGQFEVYRHRIDKPFVTNHIRNVKERYLGDFEKIRSVAYEHNTLLIFLNSSRSFHGVSPRQVTPHVRRVFDIAFGINFPLFDIAPYAENKWLTRSRALFMKLTGLHKELV